MLQGRSHKADDEDRKQAPMTPAIRGSYGILENQRARLDSHFRPAGSLGRFGVPGLAPSPGILATKPRKLDSR